MTEVRSKSNPIYQFNSEIVRKESECLDSGIVNIYPSQYEVTILAALDGDDGEDRVETRSSNYISLLQSRVYGEKKEGRYGPVQECTMQRK